MNLTFHFQKCENSNQKWAVMKIKVKNWIQQLDLHIISCEDNLPLDYKP